MSLLPVIISALLAVCSSCSNGKVAERPIFGEWRATMTKGSNEAEWVVVRGSLVWQFFKNGVFRQASDAYVEPQFYSDLVACSAKASGSFTVSEKEASSGSQKLSLVYETAVVTSVGGSCRMSDRELTSKIQPTSRFLDVLDARRTIRFEFVKEL